MNKFRSAQVLPSKVATADRSLWRVRVIDVTDFGKPFITALILAVATLFQSMLFPLSDQLGNNRPLLNDRIIEPNAANWLVMLFIATFVVTQAMALVQKQVKRFSATHSAFFVLVATAVFATFSNMGLIAKRYSAIATGFLSAYVLPPRYWDFAKVVSKARKEKANEQ